MYVMTQGGPAKTTLTPAYLSYQAAFRQQQLGPGRGDRVHPVRADLRAHHLQRWILRDKDASRRARSAASASGARNGEGGGGMTETPAHSSAHDGRRGPTEARALTGGRRSADGNVVDRSSPVKQFARLRAADLSSRCIYVYPFIIQLVDGVQDQRRRRRQPAGLIPDPFTTAAFERLAETAVPDLVHQLGAWSRSLVTAGPGVLRLAGRLLAGAAEVPRPRRAVHRGPRRDGGAGHRAADPEVPGAQLPRASTTPTRRCSCRCWWTPPACSS